MHRVVAARFGEQLIDVGLAVADAHAAHARQLLGHFVAPAAVRSAIAGSPFLRWALCLRWRCFSAVEACDTPSVRLRISAHTVPSGVPCGVKACMRCSKKPRRAPSRSPAPVTSCLGRVTSISVASCGSKNDFFVLGHRRVRWQWGWRMLSKEVRSLLQKP